MSEGGSPRILVTGFGSFPGVHLNPTAALIESLRVEPPALPRGGKLFFDVLDVEYRSLPARLEMLGREAQPDIAIHFGVSGRATGFTIERRAQNRVCTQRPDQSGIVPAEAAIRQGYADCSSSLPIERLVQALEEHGLPASLSDDAGDYLCNFLFFLSGGRHCSGFSPDMTGFVHVPAFGAALADGRAFDLSLLRRGAEVIIAAWADHWLEQRAQMKKAAPEGTA
ncbi:MAG TPA: hypothetical protein VGN97_05415 [Mesorhizobium sp.]|nr:hypothetical protein [Mesorhizobium sp.]